MGWTAPWTAVAGTIVTAANWNTYIRDNQRYLKGIGQVPTIESGLTIDNSDGDERLLLPLLSTAECTTVLNAEGEVAFDEQTHQVKIYNGTAVKAVISEADVDDTPVNGATTVPVSSNWAYDFQQTLTTQADIPYATAAGVWDRLAKGTGSQFLKMNAGATAPEWGSPTFTSKLLNHARTGSDASGDVGYTGYGFQPVALIILASDGEASSTGFGDVNLAEMCIYNIVNQTDHAASTSQIVHIYIAAGTAGQTAVLKTLDADGFTLTWTKVDAGSANITLIVLALG